MSDYEKRKQAQEWIAEKIHKHSNGQKTSEQAHKEAAEIARDTDKKQSDSKRKKGG